MKPAIPGLLAFMALVLIVGSPYAQAIDDTYVYLSIPLLLIASIFALRVWWTTQIKGYPPPTPFRTRWPRLTSALEWLNWF
ncbi:MAG TPA: hypothetical protein VFE29_01365 [Terriglobia bacterium]|nr:hypothetical protein [Terriglobia bacterium]